jgi:hypothetical protein
VYLLDSQQQDTPEKLGAIRIALDELLHTGQISEPVYFKGMVILGARYARLGDMEGAYRSAMVPSMEYYRVTQVTQMEEDADYRDAALFLATAFVAAGMVDMEELAVQPTQKMALA